RQMGDTTGCLADASQALEGTSGDERVRLLMQRAELLQHLGHWSEAVEDWTEILQVSDNEDPTRAAGTEALPRAQLLNGLAYARALAGIELEEALQHANEALEERPESSAILDTRGFIHLRLGNA